MNRTFRTALLLIVLGASTATAQTDPNNVPKPPAAELSKFAPFLGNYTVTSDYAGRTFSGTLEIKPAIKGWYIEKTIRVKNDDGRIDREFRAMITFDTRLKSYRVWRFETTPPRNNEMIGRFEGDEYIEERESNTRNGGKEIFRNRYIMANKDELRIVTEIQDATGGIRALGVTVAKRAPVTDAVK